VLENNIAWEKGNDIYSEASYVGDKMNDCCSDSGGIKFYSDNFDISSLLPNSTLPQIIVVYVASSGAFIIIIVVVIIVFSLIMFIL
jgi:hypothetical protein